MVNYLEDTYKAYKLVKVSEPYMRYQKGAGYWWKKQSEVKGQCRLELLCEVKHLGEIFEQFPIMDCYYRCGDRNVKPFVMDNEYKFRSFHTRGTAGWIGYHTDGIARIEGDRAFEYIYRTFESDPIFVGEAWNLEQIEEMDIGFIRESTKEYWLTYEVYFEE